MPAWISAGGAVLGGLFGGGAAKSAASTSVAGNIEAAKIAAEAAKFKPYSLTTGFGSSFFDPEKQTAGYTLDPRLAALRDQMYGGAEKVFGGINFDPTQATEAAIARQQGLLTPQRQAEDMQLRLNQLRSGRIGLGVSPVAMGAGNGVSYINPEQYQRDLARARADQEFAQNAWQISQADIDKAVSRATGMFQTGAGMEQLGMGALTTGADLGKAGASAGANQAQALLSGGQRAAEANLAGGLAQAGMWQNLGKTIGGQDWSKASNPFASSPTTLGSWWTAGDNPNMWATQADPIGTGLWSY